MHRLLSIVVPAYNEEDNLPLFYQEAVAALDQLDWNYELIFVDDCSTDSTPQVLASLAKQDSRIQSYRVLHNTKKAGAMAVGFAKARGEIIATLDADLQDDPGEIGKLIVTLEQGADAAIGWREHRIDSWHKRLPSLAINFISNFLFGTRFHDMNTGLKAYKREVVEWIAFQGSLFRFIPHLLRSHGFIVEEVAVTHRARRHGKSKFTVRHRLRSFYDLLTVFFLSKFSDRPLHFFGGIGMALLLIGFAFGLHLFSLWLQKVGIGDRPLLFLVVLLFVMGVQFISVGLIAELMVHRDGNVSKKHPFRKLGPGE